MKKLIFIIMILCVAIISPVLATPAAPSHLWHMDGSNGGTTFTDEANTFNFTRYGNGQTSTAQYKFGTASALFDGSADYLLTGTSSEQIPERNKNFTMVFWVRGTNLNYATCTLIGTREGDTIYTIGYGFYSLSNKIGFDAYNTNGTRWATGNSAININNSDWTQITWMVYSNDTHAIYQNGTLIISGATTGQVATATNIFRIGKFGSSVIADYNGYIDEVAIWKNHAVMFAIGDFWPQTQPIAMSPPISNFIFTLTDTSTNSPSSWVWNATNLTGNNTPVTIGTLQNLPVSLTPGNWLITLIATNSAGSNTSTRTLGINLTSPVVYYWNRTA